MRLEVRLSPRMRNTCLQPVSPFVRCWIHSKHCSLYGPCPVCGLIIKVYCCVSGVHPLVLAMRKKRKNKLLYKCQECDNTQCAEEG